MIRKQTLIHDFFISGFWDIIEFKLVTQERGKRNLKKVLVQNEYTRTLM